MSNRLTAIGIMFIGIGVAILLYIAYRQSRISDTVRTFSPYSLLVSSWVKYKDLFMNDDGRVIDHSQNGITTSEGQSYAMLRAVWIDDKPTFDAVWQWTKENLRRTDDTLFGWIWGERPDGTYGFLEGGGENTAADANTDIALSLILASRRWRDDRYAVEAKDMLADVWKLEVASAAGRPYLTAGNWAQSESHLVINPSYFAPYAWRVFAEEDPDHPWMTLVEPAYDLLNTVTADLPDADPDIRLPPDWISIDRENGALTTPDAPGLTSNYSFDAMRIPFRIALDYQWYGEVRAEEYLNKNFSKLRNDWTANGYLSGSYTRNGSALYQSESPSMYGTAIGYFMAAEPEAATAIYREKIIGLYSTDTSTFRDDLPYYDQNWLWFGAALYQEMLPLYEP